MVTKDLLSKMKKYSERDFEFYQLNSSGWSVRFGIGESTDPIESQGAIAKLPDRNDHDQSFSFDRFLSRSSLIPEPNSVFIEVFMPNEEESRIDCASNPSWSDTSIFPYKCDEYQVNGVSYKDADPYLFEVNLMQIESRSSLEGHEHPVDVQIIVLSGCYFIEMEGEKHQFLPGEDFCIAKGVYHEVKTIEKTIVIEIWNGADFW